MQSSDDYSTTHPRKRKTAGFVTHTPLTVHVEAGKNRSLSRSLQIYGLVVYFGGSGDLVSRSFVDL